jgi:conjugal transfer mating pair stabilization protein TraN
MLETIAILSTLNESAKTINPEDLTMLNGENLKCKKSTGAVGAFLDCCGDGNWGNDLGINCNSEEDKLQRKRQNNDCISIGSYCSEEIDIGIDKVCITKKYSYCCYSNKFSKIIGNATRQQGLQTWDSAEHTNCNGIPIEQLSLIDFSKVDFSELYNDINSNINQSSIEEKVKQSIGRLTNDY